ncbi:hypothetical protein R1sor_019939 [Riccia sorocarpa]|uniref:Protein root UVB sensitive 3 n=1 Tax=Riccia sorocarpa TaxID=122646 RepID=A0ABD3IGP1_9MARC
MGDVLVTELNVGAVQPVCTADLVRLREGAGYGFRFYRNRTAASQSLWKSLKSAFLPEGFPYSVTPDYVHFQIWDTLQGLSTYIRSMLSTQALLGGIGVGETKATVVGATFQWFLRDFTGMLGGILFTLVQGSNLDSNAKQWRLAADLLNDMGMLMDLVSPLFPGSFLPILCIGSIARSITGVASGATRAALTQHFALRQNAADISAKEGSQETAATMVGMLFGILLARITAGNNLAVWVSFLTLTAFHMYANYRAVRSLSLTSLNPNRTQLLLEAFTSSGKVLSPSEVASVENVLPQISGLSPFKLFRRSTPWTICFGSRISSLNPHTEWEPFIRMLIQRYGKERYMVAIKGNTVHIILHQNSSSMDCLRAFVHALYLRKVLERNQTTGSGGSTDSAEIECLTWMNSTYDRFENLLRASGWAINRIYISAGEWRADWPQQNTRLYS